MNSKIFSLIVTIVAIAAAVGAATYAIIMFLNKKKESEKIEVYDNYVECCCECDKVSEVAAEDDFSDVAPEPVSDDM